MATILPIHLSRNRLVRDVATTYAGFLVHAVLGFVTLRLMAREMGPGAFGVTTLANIFMTVIAGLGEPGIGTSLVRLASQPGTSAETIDELVVAAIRLKLAAVAAVCGLAYLLLPWLAATFMHRPEITHLLRCCLIGGALLSLAMFAGALFQIRQAFRENTATIALASAARTAVVVGLWAHGRLNLQTAVGSMILMNAVQCGLCFAALRRMLVALPWRCRARQPTAELVSYTRCLVLCLLAGTIYPRADMMFLPHFVDNRRLGYYSAAAQLCLVVPWLAVAVNLVVMPQISALRTAREMRRALRSYGLAGLTVFALLAPVTLLAGPLVHLIYGHDYGPSVMVFRVLLFAVAAELALNPLSNFWHALNRPAMLSALNVFRLSMLTVVAVVTIPRMGIGGAALAVLVSTLFPLTGQGLFLWALINHRSTPRRRPADPILLES